MVKGKFRKRDQVFLDSRVEQQTQRNLWLS